jgi:hypothetical protein
MTDKEEQSLKEAKRAEMRATEENEQIARDQVRGKANLAREQAIEKDLTERKTKQSEEQATEEIEQSARNQARRKAYLAREQAIVEDQEARKLNAKKQTRE